jgi:toxin ParE1/3/4
MAGYHLSDGAEAELGEILNWSERHFGSPARNRYAALILAALRNVADHPRQPSVQRRRVRQVEIGVYHIAHARAAVPPKIGRVGEPRHYVIFNHGADGVVEILGFVHDSMLLGRAFRRLTRG